MKNKETQDLEKTMEETLSEATNQELFSQLLENYKRFDNLPNQMKMEAFLEAIDNIKESDLDEFLKGKK